MYTKLVSISTQNMLERYPKLSVIKANLYKDNPRRGSDIWDLNRGRISLTIYEIIDNWISPLEKWIYGSTAEKELATRIHTYSDNEFTFSINNLLSLRELNAIHGSDSRELHPFLLKISALNKDGVLNFVHAVFRTLSTELMINDVNELNKKTADYTPRQLEYPHLDWKIHMRELIHRWGNALSWITPPAN